MKSGYSIGSETLESHVKSGDSTDPKIPIKVDWKLSKGWGFLYLNIYFNLLLVLCSKPKITKQEQLTVSQGCDFYLLYGFRLRLQNGSCRFIK